jgi:superfamily II DNA/RNA helicase
MAAPDFHLKNMKRTSKGFVHKIGREGRALDRGRIGVFYAFKMPKMHWR